MQPDIYIHIGDSLERDDAQLIDAVLSGDDTAFSLLVEKYQKSIHALAWQKIGDFHYAEEITQDTFLRAYQKLSTLNNKDNFLNWLYVIANRLCLNWLRQQKTAKQLQSLEDTPMEEIMKSDYKRYISELRETEATEQRFEIVRQLLEKLPERERTVMVLYYLGELTTKEISKFLGISVETIRTRLHRARQRLRNEEELLIQETFEGLQIASSIKQNIMQRIVDMKPTPSWNLDRFLPWIGIATALVVAILLIFGVSTLYLGNTEKQVRNNSGLIGVGTNDEVRFKADFTVTLGTHRTGSDLIESLFEEKCLVSRWSVRILDNADFPVVAAETTVDIVVVSLLEMGFAADKFVTLETIYDRAKELGLETCPVETAAQLRLQFLNQPDYKTGDRLSEFFVASEPFVLMREGIPQIFSVVRDDRYPHNETGVGLWLIANNTAHVGDWELTDRLFSPSDIKDIDHEGRFAFVIPK